MTPTTEFLAREWRDLREHFGFRTGVFANLPVRSYLRSTWRGYMEAISR